MQDKNIIITSLGGKKRGRKRKSKKTDSVLESFDLSSALSAPKAEFDAKKIQDVKDSESIDYTSKFDELKQVLETALSDRKKTPFTGFKKLDPRSIKKIDKFVFKNALVETKEGVVKLPALRTGGIVTSPTQALIGENGPEAVVPLEKLQSLFNKMPGISREGFGTLVRRFMPNADHIQVDSLYDRVRRPPDHQYTGPQSFDPSRGETYLDATNPVEAVRRRGRPRIEEMPSLHEHAARLDRVTEQTGGPRISKTDQELRRERFERDKERRRSYFEATRHMEMAHNIPENTEDPKQAEMRAGFIEMAEKASPEAVRDFRQKQSDARREERMEFVKQPGKDLQKRRAEDEARYQARADIPGTEANKKKLAEEEEKRRKRREQHRRDKEEFVKKLGYDPYKGEKSPHVRDEDILDKSPLKGDFGGMPALKPLGEVAQMSGDEYVKRLTDPNISKEEKDRMQRERQDSYELRGLHERYEALGVDPNVGVPARSGDGRSFAEKYSAEENQKIMDRAAKTNRETRERIRIQSEQERDRHHGAFGLQLTNQSGQPDPLDRGNQIQPPTGSQVPSVSLEASQTEQRQDISAAAGENAALLAKREDQTHQSQTKQIAAIPPSPDPKMNIRQPGFTSIAPSGGATIFDMAVRSQQLFPNWRTMMG